MNISHNTRVVTLGDTFLVITNNSTTTIIRTHHVGVHAPQIHGAEELNRLKCDCAFCIVYTITVLVPSFCTP